jgi:hypothetical protein
MQKWLELYWRPLSEFFVMLVLLVICALSMYTLVVGAREAKQERHQAISRLEQIYAEIEKSGRSLREIKSSDGNGPSKTLEIHKELLKRIAGKVGIPESEIRELDRRAP